MKYVLQDVQWSARAVLNNNGSSSAILARHDYLPFGEELGSGVGLRTGTQGYGVTDTNRQKYALTERDDTTGLDHTWFRKYESLSGRMTSPDPYGGGMRMGDPQSFNRYAYVQNDPVNHVDPSGLDDIDIGLVGDVTIYGSFLDFMSGGGGGGGGSEMGLLQFKPQDPIPQPHPSPTPATQPQRKQSFVRCFEGWRFSAAVSHFTQGSRLHGAATGIAQFAEIVPPLSIAGDAAAIAKKAARPGMLGTSESYASGLNWISRRATSGALRGALTSAGNVVTNAFAVTGAFTLGYNGAVAVGCLSGAMQ